MQKDMVHKLAGQKKLEDKYKDLDMLSKVNKVDMVVTMETIQKYLRSHCSVKRAAQSRPMSFTHDVQLLKTKWLPGY